MNNLKVLPESIWRGALWRAYVTVALPFDDGFMKLYCGYVTKYVLELRYVGLKRGGSCSKIFAFAGRSFMLEINTIVRQIKDMQGRTDALRGYL